MPHMGDILLPFQLKLLRQTFFQVFLVLLVQAGLTHLVSSSSPARLFLWGFAGLSLLAWLTTNERNRKVAFGHFLVMQTSLLICPWFMGGLRSPAAYFCLILLHPLALLFGMRVAWVWVGGFVLNVVLLLNFEMRGLIASRPPSAAMTMITLTAMIGYTLFFVASPLVYIRRLFDVASNHLKQRREVDEKLVHLSQELESRVAERSGELIRGRVRLQELAMGNAERLAQEIKRLHAAVDDVEETFRGAQDPRALKSLDRIRKAQERLERMHEALLRFCRLTGQPARQTGITPSLHEDLVRSVWEELAIRHEVPVRFSLGNLPGCKADPDLLRHVWQNLLSNAVKYSSRVEQSSVEVFQADGEICVKDNGIGFDSRQAQNLFGLFQRLHTEEDFKGTGVGLAIVHRIIEVHGGSIRAEASPGHGATFRFKLPAYRSPETTLGLLPLTA